MDPETDDREPGGPVDSADAADLALRIVDEVARRADVDPFSLPPFGESVDIVRLDSVLQPSMTPPVPGKTQLSFPYAGYDITVEQSGDFWMIEAET